VRILILGLDNAGTYVYVMVHRSRLVFEAIHTFGLADKARRHLLIAVSSSGLWYTTLLLGKTTITKKFCGEPIDSIEPTLGFNIQTIQHHGGSGADGGSNGTCSPYNLNLWDVGGQKSIRAYWRNYFESTDGLIWVVDSADRTRLQMCRHELDQLLQQERLAGASLLIFANKQDVAGALSTSEISKVLSLIDEADSSSNNNNNKRYENRHWHIQCCSAVTGEGLVEGIDWLVEDIASRIFMLG
jgi:ADP-ribosylation factor-like protein 2